MNRRDNIIKWSIISIFVGLYVLTSAVSTIHVIDFFRLSNPEWLAITLAVAFEIGAAASLAAIIILEKTSKNMVWGLFILITGMQMMGNMYYAYTHLSEYSAWSELFGLIEEEEVFQKRIMSIVSGAILPLVALGFIKSLVDYIRPSNIVEMGDESNTQRVTEREINQESELKSDLSRIIETPTIEEKIEESVPNQQFEEDLIDPIDNKETEEIAHHNENNQIEEESVDRDKSRKTEQKIAKIIAKNPEIKKQIEDKLREIDDGDKYNNQPEISTDNEPPQILHKITSGM